jgi:hypothetical protein
VKPSRTPPANTGAPDRSTRWRPVLTGDLKERAREALRDLASALREPTGAAWQQPGIARGAAGRAVLYAYLDETGIDPNAGSTARRFLDRAIELTVARPGSHSLHYGIAGVGWAAHQATWRSGASTLDALCDEIDLAIHRRLTSDSTENEFDLLSGLVGLGVYVESRLPRPIARESLTKIVERLESLAEEAPPGIAWRARSETFSPALRSMCPNGYFSLGLAHGAPAILVFLSRCAHLDIARPAALRMIEPALAWLRSQKRDVSPYYSHRVEPGKKRNGGRIAWCNGDPGVASAILSTGRLLGRPEWMDEALALARSAAECPPSRDGIQDTGLCHGTAGVAHIFNRIAQFSADSELELAASRWFERTLSMRRPRVEIAGFPAWDRDPSGRAEWVTDGAVLTGAAGVALALAAAISHLPPWWDQLFLLSEPDGFDADEPGT